MSTLVAPTTTSTATGPRARRAGAYFVQAGLPLGVVVLVTSFVMTRWIQRHTDLEYNRGRRRRNNRRAADGGARGAGSLVLLLLIVLLGVAHSVPGAAVAQVVLRNRLFGPLVTRWPYRPGRGRWCC